MILVTGTGGMVGNYFHALKNEFHEPLDLTDIDTLDVRDWNAVRDRICDGKYSHVIHLAAETNVDLSEEDPDHAYRTNVLGTHNIALACQMSNTIMLYTSTAGVFGGDGALGPFTEYSPPCPANHYGATKWYGEQVIDRLLNRYYIVRPGWMMGGRGKDKKFVSKIVQQFNAGGTIKAVNDKIGTPTFSKELVLNIRDLIKTGQFGLYHMTNHGVCSRYDVARHIVEFLGGNPDDVEPVSSDLFPLPAPRANSEATRNLNLELIGLDHMSHWKDALTAYLSEWRDDEPDTFKRTSA